MGVRLSKRELFATLGYVPHDGQRLVHRSKAPRRVLACGARWGKTTCGAMEAVSAMLSPRPDSLGWVVAPTYETSSLIFGMVVRTMREHFVHRVVEYVPREHRLVVVNLAGGRSELRAKTAEDPNGLVGTALDFVILDEAARLAPRIWENHVSQRLVDREGWALMLSTPRGCNWFYDAWKLGQEGRDPRFESWSSVTWTNPHVSRELVEHERGSVRSDSFAQEYEAVFLGSEDEPCEVCGGPDLHACAVIIVEDDDEPGACPRCKGAVHKNGKTAVALYDGKRSTMIIRLERGLDFDVPLPV